MARWSRRLDFHLQHGINPNDNELLYLVSDAINAAPDRGIGKVEIAALLAWKRTRVSLAFNKLLAMSDASVRMVTQKAVAATLRESDNPEAARIARAELRPLPLFHSGAAFASVLVSAIDPNRFAIYDQHAYRAMTQGLGHTFPANDYGAFMSEIESLRNSEEWFIRIPSAHHLDLALMAVGKEILAAKEATGGS